MVDWHVIQERLEPGERWYGDRLDTCVQRESECGCGWDVVSVDMEVRVNMNVHCIRRAGLGYGCGGKPQRVSEGSCYREAE
jgi:hypothetical protein